MVMIRAIIFDYGNTLIRFGREEYASLEQGVYETLKRHMASDVSRDAFSAVYERVLHHFHQRRDETLVETDAGEFLAALVTEFGGRLNESDLDEGLTGLDDAFVQTARLHPTIPGFLDRMAERFPLGLLSNFSRTESIVRSLELFDIQRHFRHVLVSAQRGVVKPHPSLFDEMCEELDRRPEECLFVGDNVKADIEGASRAGMKTAWIVEHLEEAHPLDHGPDADLPQTDFRLERLLDLESLLD